MRTISVERERILSLCDALIHQLAGLFHFRRPWGVNYEECINWCKKVRFGLATAPFIGMVVRKPPPRHRAFDLFVDVRKPDEGIRQNPQFCKWFAKLSYLEIMRPRNRRVGYRFAQITPTCIVEKVRFSAGGWVIVRKQAARRKKKTERRKHS